VGQRKGEGSWKFSFRFEGLRGLHRDSGKKEKGGKEGEKISVNLQNSEVKEITKDEFKAAVGKK
jgi:hypothetical protein